MSTSTYRRTKNRSYDAFIFSFYRTEFLKRQHSNLTLLIANSTCSHWNVDVNSIGKMIYRRYAWTRQTTAHLRKPSHSERVMKKANRKISKGIFKALRTRPARWCNFFKHARNIYANFLLSFMVHRLSLSL